MSTMLLRKIVLLICVGCLSTTALAADVFWDGGDDPNTPFWGIAANWDTDTVPTSADRATIELADAYVEVPAGESYDTSRFNVAGGGTTAYLKISKGATLSSLKTAVWPYSADVGVAGGGGTDGTLEVDGGTVNCASRLVIGRENDGTGTLLVNSGAVNIAGSLLLSDYDSSYSNLIMNGGTVTSGNLVSWRSRAKVVMDLNDGILDSGGLDPSLAAIKTTINTGTGEPYGYVDIDIDHGTWIMDGDTTTDIQGFKDAGELVAFGGVGTVEYDYGTTNSGRTTVYATHPLDQDPVWKDNVLVPTEGGTTTLEWDNYVDPNHDGATVTATVWLGTLEAGATEPNKLGSNYSTVFSQAVDKGTRSSITSPTLTPTQDYYWQVDFDNGGPSIIEGPVFKFLVTDNTVPVVSVKDVYAWLDAGEAVIPMKATATDDDTLTYAWTLEPVGDPNVAFDSTTIVDPNITVSRVDTYTLTLTVDDGFWDPVSASAEVFVGWNPCHAARLTPDYGGDPAGNIVESLCVVDFADFAALAATWLDNTSLTEIAYY